MEGYRAQDRELDEAIDAIGSLVSFSGGTGYGDLEAIKEGIGALRDQRQGAVGIDDEALARGLAAVHVTNSPDNREALRRALANSGGGRP